LHIVLQEEIATGGDQPEGLSRPFDRDRLGLVLGEGAGVIVLEELESARRRGAHILAEVAGYGSSTVHDRRLPRCGAALENAMRGALRTSGMAPDRIGHVHAHGLATRASDAEEAQAIRRVFGERPVPVTTAKGHFGNLGAAGGAVELIASVMALEHKRLFPILNYATPDPACPIHAAVADTPAGDSFVNLNVSPVGQASAVVVRRFAA
jgi:3-oxoacyl-[acyl-carrier-protein] synthase II